MAPLREIEKEGEKSDFGWPSLPAIVSSNSYVSNGVSSNFHKEEISLAREKSKKLRQPRSTHLGSTAKPDLYLQSKLPENQTKGLVIHRPDTLENNFENAVQAINHQLATDLQKSYIESFIKAGGDINFQDKDGKTLLYYASATLKPDVVSYILLKDKVDPNIRNKHGQTPPHGACSFLPYSRDRIEAAFSIIEALLTSGADLCARNIYGETPIDTFRHSNEADYIRLEKGKEMPMLKEIENSPLFTIYNIVEAARPKIIISSKEIIIRAKNFRDNYDEPPKQIEIKKFLPTDSKNIWLMAQYCKEKDFSVEEIKQYKDIIITCVETMNLTKENIEREFQAISTSLKQAEVVRLESSAQRQGY